MKIVPLRISRAITTCPGFLQKFHYGLQLLFGQKFFGCGLKFDLDFHNYCSSNGTGTEFPQRCQITSPLSLEKIYSVLSLRFRSSKADFARTPAAGPALSGSSLIPFSVVLICGSFFFSLLTACPSQGRILLTQGQEKIGQNLLSDNGMGKVHCLKGQEMSYQQRHTFWLFYINDDFSTITRGLPVQVTVIGPLFPIFLKADFESYEGFRAFVECAGFECLADLDKDLSKDIKEWIKEEETQIWMGPDYVTRLWQRLKDDLIEEQKLIRQAYEIFLLDHKTVVEIGNWLFDELTEAHAKEIPSLSAIIDWHIRRVRYGLCFDITPGNEHLELEPYFPNIIDRCYQEIVDLARDGKSLKNCDCCGLPFVGRKNQKYCQRISPSFRKKRGFSHKYLKRPNEAFSFDHPPFHSSVGIFRKPEQPGHQFTCQGQGSQEKYKQSLESDSEKQQRRKAQKKLSERKRCLQKKQREGKLNAEELKELAIMAGGEEHKTQSRGGS